MSRIHISLTGDPLCGKSEAATFLKNEFGFYELTGSAYLKDEAAKLGIELKERGDYGAFQRKLRTERSATFINDLMFQIPSNRVLNVGMRNKLDAEAMLHPPQGVKVAIIAMSCPIEIRFTRINNDDPKYPKVLEEFAKVEEIEYDDPDPFGQHTHWVMKHATHSVDASQPLTTVQADLRTIMNELGVDSR